METNRPTLSDPKEYSLVKSIYFAKDSFEDKLDPIENLERMDSKQRNIKNNAR